MSKSCVVYLIKEEVVTTELKVQETVISKRRVFAELESVSGDEFFRAGQLGIKSKKMVTVNLYEYHDETLLELDGKQYDIYRTYVRKGTERIELYLSEAIEHEDDHEDED